MPLLKIETSVAVPPARRDVLLARVSRLAAEATGKPESYMMVALEEGALLMAGKPGPAAYCDVRAIGGLTQAVNADLTRRLCDLLKAELGIDPGRVYVTFTEVAATNWGCNGATFG